MEKNSIVELLEAADWKNIIFKLTRYAFFMASKYTWKTGKSDQLLGGKTPEDIACEAVEKVWKGNRDWDPDKYPDLYTHLKWIVKSDLGHLCSSIEHQKTSRMPEPRQGEETPVLGCDEIVPDPSFSIQRKILTPEEELLDREKKAREERLKIELLAMVKGDEDLELLLLCFEEGFDKPETIASQTGWEISKVYNLKRKLFRKAIKVIRNNRQGE
jgi:hypothetical protein